jgi:hypothetical protein
MIRIFTSMATSLLNTGQHSNACSVKALGNDRRLPNLMSHFATSSFKLFHGKNEHKIFGKPIDITFYLLI